MTLYTQLLALIADRPLAVVRRVLPTKADLIVARDVLAHLPATEAAVARMRPDREVRQEPGSVAVLPLRGVILQRGIPIIELLFGDVMATLERFARRFREAMANPNIKAVVIDVDSPGGEVYGVEEVAAMIREEAARGGKPVIAMVNSLAASAAYYIASAADEIVLTPSGEVGSIGVYTVHEDISRLLDAEGVTVTWIAAGKYKVEGNMTEPLGEEARAAMQERVDGYYEMFVRAVAAGRSRALGRRVSPEDVRGGFGEGRVVGARDALAMGMVDRIATMEQTLARFGVPQAPTQAARADTADPAPAAADPAPGPAAGAVHPEPDEAPAEPGEAATAPVAEAAPPADRLAAKRRRLELLALS